MKGKRGVISLYDGFRLHLRTPAVRERVIPLQFAGRIEDYLVKEFVSYLHHASLGRRFAQTNQGCSGQQKVDIAILRGTPSGEAVVESFLEAKYIMNRHRRSDKPWGAMDQLRTTLDSLQHQLELKPKAEHGFHRVRLSARSTKVYGLVFASYTRREDESDESSKFFGRVLELAAAHGMRYHDLERPYFRPVYQDEPVTILGEKWSASLKIGLWRL
jgi:hypothetical protein